MSPRHLYENNSLIDQLIQVNIFVPSKHVNSQRSLMLPLWKAFCFVVDSVCVIMS